MTNLDAVEGLDAVTRSLARRTPEQLAALLTRHAEPLARRPAPTELRGLAQALWSYETLHHLVLHLDHPRLQVLATTARISQERAGRDAPGPAAPAPGADYQSLMAHRLSFAHLATEPVPPEDVYAALGAAAPGPARSAAESALRHLCDDGLAAPAEDGTIVVPPRAPQLLAAYDLGPFLAHAPQPVPDDTAPGAPAATVPPTSPHDESRAAAATLAATVDRLLAALATQPAALRKSGGLAVREIKRLAKAAGATEPHTRLLLDLALAADLIALTRSPSGITALPTGAYDDWLARPPGARLAPLLAAWSGLWDIPTHTPAGETPTALVRGHDRHAPALRHALLAALAAVPLEGGTPLPPLPFTEPPRQETGTRTPWEDLLGAADWHRPLAVTRQPMAGERAAHTLHEAACLGLVAHGTLTPLGRALLADPRSLDEPLGDLLPPLLEQAHFQADLTAVVPGRPTAALQALLTAAADRESEGHAVTWRFTPRSVRRALDAGHRAETLLDDLARASATGTLPQPLGYLVRDAARSHGRMRVLPAACCIRSDDEALVDELAAHRDLRDLGLRVIAPTVLVSSREPAATLDALRAAGYAPALESDTGTTTVERLPAHRTKAPAPPRNSHAPLALAHRLLGLPAPSQEASTTGAP
ncbi:Helicase conserved C-terminal domain-containing protein [Streptomyces sp. KS_16]|uniref:helicase-associated domain-containing protein n=1 Tax=unclassified Streptomyces TaxID=2593676 RepID=UPI0008831780|nr:MULTISPECIES: helicase-associated domain-containing protein [unclassified Streptomyces]PBC81795.1 XPB/Ssl2-like helicase family protein [Streptomyces sp. 2321.6]SDR53086.1 Helicase conserved C-terminal domain-containing protein [Streptomyces sp. KS_16]SNC66524.1 Helicase conserved C-terminal domain-containing protein [Streptomyces sp. 2114.4]